jgi:hypothetical protein
MSDISLGFGHSHIRPRRHLIISDEPRKEVEASGDYIYIRDRSSTVVFHRSVATKLAKFLNEELLLDVMGDL